jgi:hypothetical protein
MFIFAFDHLEGLLHKLLADFYKSITLKGELS